MRWGPRLLLLNVSSKLCSTSSLSWWFKFYALLVQIPACFCACNYHYESYFFCLRVLFFQASMRVSISWWWIFGVWIISSCLFREEPTVPFKYMDLEPPKREVKLEESDINSLFFFPPLNFLTECRFASFYISKWVSITYERIRFTIYLWFLVP